MGQNSIAVDSSLILGFLLRSSPVFYSTVSNKITRWQYNSKKHNIYWQYHSYVRASTVVNQKLLLQRKAINAGINFSELIISGLIHQITLYYLWTYKISKKIFMRYNVAGNNILKKLFVWKTRRFVTSKAQRTRLWPVRRTWRQQAEMLSRTLSRWLFNSLFFLLNAF